MYTSKPMSMIRSPVKNIPEKIPHEVEQQVMYGIQESVYLTNETLKKKVRGVEFQHMDNHYFWKYKEKTL